MGYILQIIGAILVFFRLWIVFIKLDNELGDKKGHVSRFIALYFLIAMMLDFQNNVFTLISVLTAPAMLIAFFAFDVSYYSKDVSELKEKKFWLILERITLHPPVVFYVVYFYFTSSGIFYLELFTVSKIVAGIIICVGPIFTFDPRVIKKDEWPRGPAIIIGAILVLIGNFTFYYYFAVKTQYFEIIDLKSLL